MGNTEQKSISGHTEKTRNPAANIALILALLVFSVYAIVKTIFPGSQGIKTADAPLSAETEAELLQLAETIEDIQAILEHSEDYPASLLQLLSKNLEAMEFVKHYPEQNLVSPSETVGFVTPGVVPLLMQWDERWGYATYGSDYLAVTGCGPTCLSMVAVGLTGDITVTPYVVAEYAEEHGHYADGYGSSWTLMSEGSSVFHLTCRELPLDKNTMLQELNIGHPIICSMNAGDFTDSGHYIVLTAVEDGKFCVNDPNSRERSETLWDYETIASQIGNLWSFQKSTGE